MDEAHVHEIAEREVTRFVRLLGDELAATPIRADGNVNARDLYRALDEAEGRFSRGEAV